VPYAALVATLRDRLSECDAAIRRHLSLEETVIATGRCQDITDLGDIDMGGGGWTFVLVTDRRLWWVPGVNLRFETALDLDGVNRATEETWKHRYGITLHHAPLVRRHVVPEYRLMRWRWGDTEQDDTFLRTRLAFSRSGTKAAVALRDQLAERNIILGGL
jgi:hypothetical protein